MRERIEEFGRILRHNGMRVSTAEVLDAVRSVAVVGIEHPAHVRTALAATLVKQASDRDTFDTLFDLYFLRDAALWQGLRDAPPGHTGPGEAGDESARALADDLAHRTRHLSAQLRSLTRMGLGLEALEVVPLIRAASARLAPPHWLSPFQVGNQTFLLLKTLDVAGAEREAVRTLGGASAQAGLSARAQASLEAQVHSRFGRLRNLVRAYVEQLVAQHSLRARRELTAQLLAQKPLNQLSDGEIVKLRGEVERLARLLRARITRVPTARQRGRLDLRRTLRSSLACGGVPFVIRRRVRKPRKPRLIILCDVSDSVRNVSRFMLQLVYALQSRFDRVQAFAFVADLGEITELFRQCDLDRALALVYAGAAVNIFANSNYGRAFEQFVSLHQGKVSKRTTVLIIGDGRNNYNRHRSDLLGDIRRHAQRVLWLTPEAETLWGFGDSAMNAYAIHCDKVLVARDLESLRTVIDGLVS